MAVKYFSGDLTLTVVCKKCNSEHVVTVEIENSFPNTNVNCDVCGYENPIELPNDLVKEFLQS